MVQPLIQLKNVFKKFGDSRVLRGVSLCIYPGEIPDIFFISQRIVMLDEGKIRFEGTPEEIRRCDDTLVQQFIQGLEKPRDALTGMATQLQGERKFQEELARLQSDQITFSAVMFAVENLDELNEKIGHVAGQIMLKNFAAQIKQRLDITDSCSRYSLDRILVVLHSADMEEARKFATRLARELKTKDLLNSYEGFDGAIRISAGYAQADEDSLIKEVLARAESKDSRYFEFELN